jgi:hypothetical protein
MEVSKVDEYVKTIHEFSEMVEDKKLDWFEFLTVADDKYRQAYRDYNKIIDELKPYIYDELKENPTLYGYNNKLKKSYIDDFVHVYYLISEMMENPKQSKYSLFYRLIENANKRYESLQVIEVEPLKEVQLPLDTANKYIFTYIKPGEYYIPVSNTDESKYIHYEIHAIDKEKAHKYEYSTPFDELISLYVDAAINEGIHYFDATQIYKYFKGTKARPDQATIDKIDAYFEKYSNSLSDIGPPRDIRVPSGAVSNPSLHEDDNTTFAPVSLQTWLNICQAPSQNIL